MDNSQLLFQVFFTAFFLIVAVIVDLKCERIPNVLSFIIIVTGFSINGYFGGLNGLLLSTSGFSLAFVVLLPTFILKVLGAGDIKLMMGVGALMGPSLLIWSIAYGIVAGALTSLLLILWKTGFSGCYKSLKRYWDCFYLRTYFKPEADEAAGQTVPYAPALAIGWLWACSLNPEISHLYAVVSQSLIS
ncbi:A24 family peptidase [Shewanella sp. 125m-7]